MPDIPPTWHLVITVVIAPLFAWLAYTVTHLGKVAGRLDERIKALESQGTLAKDIIRELLQR